MRSSPLLLFIIFIFLVPVGCAVRPADEAGGGLRQAILREEMARYESSREEFTPIRSTDAYYNYLRGELAIGRDQFDDALEHFRRAAQAEAAAAPFLRLRLAQVLIRKGELRHALDELNRIPADTQDRLKVLEIKAGVLATLKETDQAIEAYRELIALSPRTNEEAYLLLTSLLLGQGKVSEARIQLNDLILKRPESAFGYYYMGRIAESERQGPEAERLYRKALELNPGADTIRLDLARCLGVMKRFREGIDICEGILRRDQENINARKLLSQLLLGANRVDDALKNLESLRDREDDARDTRFKIALIKLERRDFTGAETELNLVLADHPQEAGARYYLALAYAGLQRIGEAVQQLKLIRSDDKLFIDSRLLLAHLLRQEKRYAEAATALEEARAKEPDDRRLLSFLVAVHKDADQLGEAVQTLRRLLELEPRNDAHLFTMGVFYDDLGKRQEALKAMERAIALNPKNANALNYLGYALAEDRVDLKRAEGLIRRALAIERDNGYFIDSLGWVYFQMGRFQDAARELERAVKFTPDDAVILEHFGHALWKTGKRDRAIETFRLALTHAPASDDKDVATRLTQAIESIEREKRGR